MRDIKRQQVQFWLFAGACRFEVAEGKLRFFKCGLKYPPVSALPCFISLCTQEFLTGFTTLQTTRAMVESERALKLHLTSLRSDLLP